MLANVIADESVFSAVSLRGYVGVSCFIMWIKVFYWMRLFSKTAYFVKLITQTIADVGIFLSMTLIILLAFANLFFFLNIDSTSKDRALIHYTGFPIFDSLIAMYMMSLGDFHYGKFEASAYDLLLWCAFMLATFLTMVVFMNMIIAIMANTFANVMAQ